MSNTITVYTSVKSVEMADTSNIFDIVFEPIPENLEDDFNNLHKGFPELCAVYNGLWLTKEEAFEASSYVRVSGWGSYSGRKIWQLQDDLQQEILDSMKGVKFELY